MVERKGAKVAIYDASGMDVVKVVRCRDCRRWINNHVCLAWSRFGTIETKADQYCCYGEKKDE